MGHLAPVHRCAPGRTLGTKQPAARCPDREGKRKCGERNWTQRWGGARRSVWRLLSPHGAGCTVSWAGPHHPVTPLRHRWGHQRPGWGGREGNWPELHSSLEPGRAWEALSLCSPVCIEICYLGVGGPWPSPDSAPTLSLVGASCVSGFGVGFAAEALTLGLGPGARVRRSGGQLRRVVSGKRTT